MVADTIAAWADQVLDWLEQDPVSPHAKRRRMADGQWAVRASLTDEDWVLLWRVRRDSDGSEFAYVTYIGVLG